MGTTHTQWQSYGTDSPSLLTEWAPHIHNNTATEQILPLFLKPTCNSIDSSVRRCTDQHLRPCHVLTGWLRCHAITFHKQARQVSCRQCFAWPWRSLDHCEWLLECHLDSLFLVEVQLPSKLIRQEGHIWLVNCVGQRNRRTQWI